MSIAELVCMSTPPVALLALAREIAGFYGELDRREPTAAEASLLTAARIYGHAAGFSGVDGLRSLLQAVDALDTDRIHAAALLDHLWAGVHVASESERPSEDPAACIDAAFERGLRLAQPPAAWWTRSY